MKTTHPVLRASALAVGFALASMAAQAQTTTFMQATGSYDLNNTGVMPLVSTWTGVSNNVDVLSFPGAGLHTAGLHSYGSTTGDFGSRSSGTGIYDVTGSFKIVQSFTNTTSSSGSAAFNFYITPGMLANYIGSAALTGTDYVKAGISFDVKLTKNSSTSSIWGSAATLNSNASGTQFSFTGDNLYTQQNPSTYTINGLAKTVDLGVINAGETIELSYELKTFASGVSSSTGTRDVPETTYVIPAYWVDPCSGGGYGLNAFVSGYGEPCTQPRYEVPAQTVVVPGYTISDGTPSGSHANAGDPFTIDLGTGQPLNTGGQWVAPQGFNQGIALAPVPEPGTWGLMALGLGAVGFVARRRKAAAA
jgi:hypothetical protein